MLPEGQKHKLLIQRWHCLVLWTRRKSNENLCCRKLPQRDHSSILLGIVQKVEKFTCMRKLMKLLRNPTKLTNLIKIERIISWHWTVESRLQESCPSVAESMWSTFVPFTNTCNTREYCLWGTVEIKITWWVDSIERHPTRPAKVLSVKKTCCMSSRDFHWETRHCLMAVGSWKAGKFN